MSILRERSTLQRIAFAVLMLVLIGAIGSGLLAGSNQSVPAQQKARVAVDNDPQPLSAAEQTALAEHQQDVRHLPNGGIAVRDLKHDVSPPLRDIAPIVPVYEKRPIQPEHDLPEVKTPKLDRDPVLQTIMGKLAIPTPIVSFEGLYNYWGGIPPDTVGDVGPNHYVQQVNVGFQIFNKNTGASLYGPANFNTLFRGFGGPCETRNDGDPITLYDQLADRWFLLQFISAAPYGQCIAISTTGDPTGSYYRYQFAPGVPNTFDDYPHVGVWPDGYYMSTNQFANGAQFAGAGFFAFEREKMLRGQQADMIAFNRPPPAGGFLSSDLDGYNPPPADSPNYFLGPVRTTANQYQMYKFDVITWDPPAAALEGPILIAAQPWDEDICTTTREQCIPQPPPGTTLEAIADRFMHRLAYRNFGTHESLVSNHTVDAGSSRAGIRWFEIRGASTITPTIFQQGTFAPLDGNHRWMGSLSMDGAGNMALGYSVSSLTLFPSIRYTGRLAGDPLGQMTQGEGSIIEGGGSQTETIAGRWGDYSSMNIDVDDCTFWYTQEYYSHTGLRNWRTRIGSFKLPGCVETTPTPLPTATGPVPTATQTVTATMTPCSGYGLNTVGSITQQDPTMTGRLGRTGVVSTCAAPKACPGAGDALVRHYDAYVLSNSSGATQCVTVSVVNNCNNNALLSAAYLGSFNPNNVCENYLADMGTAGPDFTYSFNVPAGAIYVVTVLENSPDVGCTAYSININPTPCSGGTPVVTQTSTATRTATATATATPCVVTPLLAEGFETGTLNTFTATTTLGESPWTVVTGTVNSGVYSAHVEDPNEPSDQQLTQVNAVAIPNTNEDATLRFFHTYSFEAPDWDGGVLEYSTNGGTNWIDAGPLITEGGYTGVITATAGNPLSGRSAWVGVKPGHPSFSRVTANLNTLKGQSVKFRFREGSDLNTGAPGWWVDDIRIQMAQQQGCPTATATSTTLATATATSTATATATPACTLTQDYAVTVSSGATIVPGTSRVPGSVCNSCSLQVGLPFTYQFYGTPYSQVNISNKGVVQFVSNSADGNNTCLPNPTFNDAIFAYWDDHNTNINDTLGIFTSVSGTAPNRIFNIEWRAGYVANDVRSTFEVRLYEGQPKFDVIYGRTRQGFSATIGVQKGTGERFTQYACNVSNSVPNGTKLTFDQRVCTGIRPGVQRKP